MTIVFFIPFGHYAPGSTGEKPLRHRLQPVRAALVAILLLAHPGVALSQQDGPITTGDQTVTDREIDARIEAIFDEIKGLQGVFVTVRAGVVTLRGKVTETSLSAQAEALANRVNGVVAVSNEIGEVTSLPVRLAPVYERLIQRTQQVLGFLPLFSVAILSWILVFVAGMAVAGLKWPWDRVAPNAFIADLLRQMFRLVFFVLGAVLALDIIGATALLGTILGAAGIVGLAIGFAVRDTVENYIASILLSIRQPFRPKDYISLEDFEGYVIQLTSRATILLDPDGNHVRIPNATVFKANIVNYSRNPQRRFLFQLGVDSESNLELALEKGLATIENLGFVLDDPGPDAWIEKIGDSNVVLTFTGWIDQNITGFLKARSEAMRLVKLALEASGFTLPEPIYRIRVDGALPETGVVARQPAKKGRPPTSSAAESQTASDTSLDAAVTRKVDEERAVVESEDLLHEKAPDELSG
jgi:small conductance mechanosensitive channel